MKLLVFVIFIAFLPQECFAQEDNALNNYTPPPLFGEPKFPPPKIKQPRVDELPDVSKEVERIAPSNTTRPQLKSKPRVIKEVKPISSATVNGRTDETRLKVVKPKPTLKPVNTKSENQKPQPSTQKAITPEEVNISNEPIDLLQSKNKKETDKNTSIVTGPKTMPSYKKKEVASEQIYRNKTEINLIERAPPSEEVATPNKLILDAPLYPENKKHITLVYTGKQITIQGDAMTTQLSSLTNYLKKNTKSVEIRAYAALNKDIPNSDRRIALNRGLAVREFLLSNGIAPHQINLKSYGNKTSKQPQDFVEIHIIE